MNILKWFFEIHEVIPQTGTCRALSSIWDEAFGESRWEVFLKISSWIPEIEKEIIHYFSEILEKLGYFLRFFLTFYELDI